MADKHLIFLVHGMGSFKEGWHQETESLLRDSYDRYTLLGGLIPFDERFQVVGIYYDDKTFEKVRAKWKEQQAALSEALKLLGITTGALATLDGLAKSTEKDTFINTHVLDVLLYRFVPQIATWARDEVRKQILEALKQQIDETGRLSWSVIAHSLGTAVIHDALHELYTDEIPFNGQQVSLLDVTRPRMIAMVANVSRVLETFKDVYLSLVRPGAPEGSNICRRYLNIWHEWDPFPQPKKFRPTDTWPSINIRNNGLYEDIKISAIGQLNVHDLDHYLASPKVHIPVFHGLINQAVVPMDTQHNAFAEYIGSLPTERFDEYVKSLKDVQLGEESTWAASTKSWLKFLQ